MRKLASFYDLDKEAAWLGRLAEEGWAFRSRGLLGYDFDKADAGRRVYRIDYRVFRTLADFDDYVLLFHDAGWRHVWGSKSSGFQYFEAVGDDPADDIFSDTASRASRYRAIALHTLPLLAGSLCLAVSAAFNGGVDLAAMADPRSLYFTPGLWERAGIPFVAGFLLETPFVLMRSFWWVLAFACLGISAFSQIMLFKLSRKAG
ncbi:hypothetical protein B5F40_14325 [Gordonibacter sp. An230]|uniref:DUF2812 domain-containing protein n=1 Tax=Gordonibacter sp. An230 TaxID=1965592 RepID=UPI000B37058A|nr:DUF2812 domain-containing protein [Gordonibacter sp. An230]OUO87031.1 hypothetical protein B5F40_14325 [Gordonibacter sp. An230]